jgi:hypothetical protein
VSARPALGLAPALAALGCDPPQDKGVIDAASPNASIQPAPLASTLEPPDAGTPSGDVGAAASAAASGAPDAMVPEKPLDGDTAPGRDLGGVVLAAAFRWRDVPPPPKAAEVNANGIQEAAKATALTWKIEIADTGRMRATFTSRALPLPTFSELRARSDNWGNIVVWPSASQYRVVPPGALRTVMGERRVDVTPLAPGAVKAQGDGKKLGVATRKVELTSALGRVLLELGKVPEAGDGGQLLCRVLVELAAVDPRTSACQPGEVPLGAVYTWLDGGGGVAFEVTRLDKSGALPGNDLLVPPPLAQFVATGLPASDGVFLTREELAAFRSVPLQLPPVTDPTIPGEGFMAQNKTDVLSYLLVDGVPAVAVQPGKEQYVIGPPRGRYIVQWRTFLGERIEPPRIVEMPNRFVTGVAPAAPGAPDAGAPDAH